MRCESVRDNTASKEISGELVARDLYAFYQFENLCFWELSRIQKRQQRHQAIRSNEIFQSKTFDDAPVLLEHLPVIVAAVTLPKPTVGSLGTMN